MYAENNDTKDSKDNYSKKIVIIIIVMKRMAKVTIVKTIVMRLIVMK